MNVMTLSPIQRHLALRNKVWTLTLSVFLTAACGETDPDTDKVMVSPSGTSTSDSLAPTASGTTPAPSNSLTPVSSVTEPTPSNTGGTSTPAPSSSAPPSNVPSFEEISGILLVTCGNIICHMPPPYTPPDLSGGGSVDLHTQLTTYQVNNCAGSTLVVPGDVAESALVKVVSGECGGLYMPPDTYFPFTDEELSKIKAWIAAGAPNQ